MLKKINVKQLREGMYIHELCSSWIDTPFWQTSFMLEDPSSLDKIRKSKIQEAWIDTGKGLDVLEQAEAENSPPAEEEIFTPETVIAFQKNCSGINGRRAGPCGQDR